MLLPNLNIWPLLFCTLLSMGVGMLWYSPLLFADQWMKFTGITKAQIKKGHGNAAYTVSMLTGFLMAITLSSFFEFMDVQTPIEGIAVAVVAWCGFLGLPLLNHFMYDKRPRGLFLIESLYDLVTLVLMALVLSVWR